MEWFWWCLAALLLIQWNGIRQKKERIRKAKEEFNPKVELGGARFHENGDLRRAGAFKGGGDALRVGWSPKGNRPIYYRGVGHALTVSCARWGKGIFLLIPALLSWANSVVCVDPKMELCAVTGRYRRRFGRVYVLDPFHMGDDMPDAVRGLRCVGFNPMADLDVNSPGFHADCDRIASACVWDDGNGDHHWSISARLLVSGVIAALARHGDPKKDRNLKAVVRTISEGNVLEFCREVVSKTKDDDIRQKLGRFAVTAEPAVPGQSAGKPGAESSKEITDVIATAITQLGFISGAIAGHLADPDSLRWNELREKRGTSVFICVPLNRLDTHGDKYFRLVTESLLASLLNTRGGRRSRILMVIDECAQLGPRMKSLENAMGMAAGACGLQLWLIYQSLSQLIGMWPHTWQNVIQNCGVMMWGRARDNETREQISKLGGITTVTSRSRGVSIDLRTGEPMVNDGVAQHTRPLIHPHEAGMLPPDEMYLFMEKLDGPVKAKLKPFFKCGFSGYGDNPYFQKRGGLTGGLFGK